MAGRACKTIINNMLAAIAKSLEEVVIMERGDRLNEDVADRILQTLADIDIAAYRGGKMPKGGLQGVVEELIGFEIFTSEVWEILTPPNIELAARREGVGLIGGA